MTTNKARVILAGKVALTDEDASWDAEDRVIAHPRALVLFFDSDEDLRKAMKAGSCDFEFRYSDE